jgi:hypothetical protein
VAFHVLPDRAPGSAFASCADGTLTVIHQDSPDRYRAIETLQTPKGSRNVVCVRIPANSVPRRRAAEEVLFSRDSWRCSFVEQERGARTLSENGYNWRKL